MSQRSKRSVRVALMLNTKTHVTRECMRGIAAYSAKRVDWDLNMSTVDNARVNTRRRAIAADAVLVELHHLPTAAAVSRARKPVVNIGAILPPGITSVFPDPEMIGKTAAEYLHDRGFRRFGYFAYYGRQLSIMRGQAFKSAIEQMGCDCSWYQLREPKNRAWRRERALIKAWLKKLEKPVAILTVGDQVARLIAMACDQAGLSVPNEVAILGVGNDELICQISKPEISSIDSGAFHVGFEAARLLHQILEGKEVGERHPLRTQVRVVTRESTDVIAADDGCVGRAARAISDRLSEGASIKGLVKEMDVSRRTLERAFREQLGRTIHEEVVRAQLQRAVQLLEEGTLGLSEVAARCGMRDTCRLCRFVKKHTGITPLEYRRTHQRRM